MTKKLLLVCTFILNISAPFASFAQDEQAMEAQTIATCDKVIDGNVNESAQDTLLSAGSVKLVRYKNGFVIVDYDFSELRFQNHGSIMALNTGCTEAEGSPTLSKCSKDGDVLLMKRSYSGGGNSKILGSFNEKTLQLRIVYKTRASIFYKKMSDVIFQCQQ